MKECCDVLYHNYVDLASIYRILPQIRPDLDLDTLDLNPTQIHQIHWISGRIQIWCGVINRYTVIHFQQ